MAGTRRKPQRRGGGRKKRASRGGSTWIWALALVAAVGGKASTLGDGLVAAAPCDVGVVHQRLNLVPGISALDNVALPLELDGWSMAGSFRTIRGSWRKPFGTLPPGAT